MRRITFHKGHATRNDFVIIDGRHGMQDLVAADVAALCDRRGGIGADGVLRVVLAQHVAEWDGDPGLWFMDYRNADGSVAEMCGNGLRVFARHLVNEQLVSGGEFEVATRAGVKQVRILRGGLVSTNLGRPVVDEEPVTITHEGLSRPATKVDVGNPHAVVDVDEATLDGLDLQVAPAWQPQEAFPQGVNVEFASHVAPGRIRMRVHERGSGETMSCGTGVVAVAAAHRVHTGHRDSVVVTVPGGKLSVDFEGDDAWLTGPAVVVGRGEFWGG